MMATTATTDWNSISTTTTNNTLSASNVGSSTSLTGNISTGGNYYINGGSTLSFYDPYSSFVSLTNLLDSVLTYLTEDELADMLEKIKMRMSDSKFMLHA